MFARLARDAVLAARKERRHEGSNVGSEPIVAALTVLFSLLGGARSGTVLDHGCALLERYSTSQNRRRFAENRCIEQIFPPQ